jgi:hypothetical protein
MDNDRKQQLMSGIRAALTTAFARMGCVNPLTSVRITDTDALGDPTAEAHPYVDIVACARIRLEDYPATGQ